MKGGAKTALDVYVFMCICGSHLFSVLLTCVFINIYRYIYIYMHFCCMIDIDRLVQRWETDV